MAPPSPFNFERFAPSVFDGVRDGVILLDQSDRIVFWNDGAEKIFGYTREEALHRHFEHRVRTENAQLFLTAKRNLEESGAWKAEITHVDREGRDIVVESRWTLCVDDAGTERYTLVIDTDITEKKKLEVQYFRSQRMESIGVLAGGIAHDLNNILSPILMATQFLQMTLTDDQSLDMLRMIETNTQRGAEMAKQILAISRGIQGEKIPIHPKYFIKELEKIIKETFPKSIHVETSVSNDLHCIYGDALLLHQVVLRLCIRSRDSMPQGGTLYISAKNQEPDPAESSANGQYVNITISDSGPDVSQEEIRGMFRLESHHDGSPGFAPGLYMVNEIIKNHDGLIRVENRPGKGVSFHIRFPAHDVGHQDIVPDDEVNPLKALGDLVLVVDDEATIREVTKTALEASGFRVLVAKDGVEALTLASQHHGEISVVILDMLMPIIDGPTCLHALRQIAPGLRCIAVSGLPDSGRASDLGGLPIHAVLQKPFRIGTMLQTLRRVLEG